MFKDVWRDVNQTVQEAMTALFTFLLTWCRDYLKLWLTWRTKCNKIWNHSGIIDIQLIVSIASGSHGLQGVSNWRTWHVQTFKKMETNLWDFDWQHIRRWSNSETGCAGPYLLKDVWQNVNQTMQEPMTAKFTFLMTWCSIGLLAQRFFSDYLTVRLTWWRAKYDTIFTRRGIVDIQLIVSIVSSSGGPLEGISSWRNWHVEILKTWLSQSIAWGIGP